MTTTPPPAIVQTVDGLLRAANDNDAAAVQSYFSGDAVVIDESSPFMWRSAQSGADWWHNVQHRMQRGGMSSIHAELRGFPEYRLDREGDDAFVETALRIHITTTGGKTSTEPGIWTLTLHRTGNNWRVTSATWTTVAP